MIVDFGETYSSRNYQVYDTSGALANAGTVTATVTLPDQTTVAPTVANPSTGVYNFDYLTTQAGLHEVLVSATGGILATLVRRWTESFYVAAAGSGSIVSFEATLAHLNIPGTTTVHNEELRPLMRAATEVVEYLCGPCIRHTGVEAEVQGGWWEIHLPHDRVLSLTSLTPVLTDAPTVTLGDLNTSARGVVRHTGKQAISSGPLTAVYVTGRSTIPWALQEATKIVTKHLWETQRGPGRPGVLGQQTTQGGETTFLPVFGFAIPNRAMDLMKTSLATAGVA